MPDTARVAFRLALLTIVVIVLLAGCGGGGSSARLSKSEFDAKANAICDKYTKRINGVTAPKGLKDIPHYVDKVLPILREGTSKLDDLKPPSDLQATTDQWRQILHDEVKQAEALKQAADKGDTAQVLRIVSETSSKNKRGNALAAQLGAQTCAKD